MKIKSFLIILYGIAGLAIALFTAVMTYLIIDEPIGFKMLSQIGLTILMTLPIIVLFSYFIGSYLSEKFRHIRLRLDAINEEQFLDQIYEDNIHDITAIHQSINRLSRRLETTITELQNKNKNLTHMMTSLSHDIKTPLTIINGYLEELEDGLVPKDEIIKIINILKKETDYFGELSSEVIHYLQSLQNTRKKETIYLKRFSTQEIFPLVKVEKSVILKCSIDEEQKVEFNPIALKKILLNLMHNASKFTTDGYIEISGDSKCLWVEDSGIGISVENSKNIFEPFVCLDESKNREKSGFGLGLSIAQNLALSNGYELSLDSRYHDGCRFIMK